MKEPSWDSRSEFTGLGEENILPCKLRLFDLQFLEKLRQENAIVLLFNQLLDGKALSKLFLKGLV